MRQPSDCEPYSHEREERFDTRIAKTKIALAEIAGLISLGLLLIGGLAVEIKALVHYLGL